MTTIEREVKDCFIVFALDDNGCISIRAICRRISLAKHYRKTVLSPYNNGSIIKSWIETARMDHLYGQNGFEVFYGGPVRKIR